MNEFAKAMFKRNWRDEERMVAFSFDKDGDPMETFDLLWYATRDHGGKQRVVTYGPGAFPVRTIRDHGWDESPNKIILSDEGRVKHTWMIAEHIDNGPDRYTGTKWSLLVEFENGRMQFFDSRLFEISAGNLPLAAYHQTQEVTLFDQDWDG